MTSCALISGCLQCPMLVWIRRLRKTARLSSLLLFPGEPAVRGLGFSTGSAEGCVGDAFQVISLLFHPGCFSALLRAHSWWCVPCSFSCGESTPGWVITDIAFLSKVLTGVHSSLISPSCCNWHMYHTYVIISSAK